MISVFDFFAANPEAKSCFVALGNVFATMEEAVAYCGGTAAKPEEHERPAEQDPPAAPVVTEPTAPVVTESPAPVVEETPAVEETLAVEEKVKAEKSGKK